MSTEQNNKWRSFEATYLYRRKWWQFWLPKSKKVTGKFKQTGKTVTYRLPADQPKQERG